MYFRSPMGYEDGWSYVQVLVAMVGGSVFCSHSMNFAQAMLWEIDSYMIEKIYVTELSSQILQVIALSS